MGKFALSNYNANIKPMHTSYNYTYIASINIKQTCLHQQQCKGCAQNIAP